MREHLDIGEIKRAEISARFIEQTRRVVMEKIIDEILKTVPNNAVFDSHTIIEIIINNYSDFYLQCYNHSSTELYHSYIAQLIAKYELSMLERIGQSWSRNLHGKYSICTCWKKK